MPSLIPPHVDLIDSPSLEQGSPYPQGASYDGEGVNFSLFAEAAEAVDLCLFRDTRPVIERHRIRMKQNTKGIWHCYIPGLKPGQIYGYRVHGPYDPQTGQRFNPNKVLLDPYAKGMGRRLKWDDCLFGYSIGSPDEDLSFDARNNAYHAPLGCVVDESFDWEGDEHLNRPWHDTVIYEAHVRGMTMKHPGVPKAQRGTYAGLASDVILDHLLGLGVTAIELMPVHHFVHERHLVDQGLSNYWGYNTLGFFMLESSYSSQRAPEAVLSEFKQMVKKFHKAGIEVILDVVYNHTAEGNHLGPSLSFRGIDNKTYYRLVSGNERFYMDYTGCGNTLNMMHPHSLRLLMDSLRYWVTEVHIDGFRFDLASALARELHEVNQLGAFLDTIYQDPVLATVKLIAEPWDLGEGGYQVGNFPVNWTEWNGMYRDSVRRFWKGDEAHSSEAAVRVVGSPDLYAATRRKPSASINFITAHDGFTLKDLVSYNEKHNEANGHDNTDGTNDNYSWNCGAEGETDDPEVLGLRIRQRRNLFATLMLSQGVPMISGGDEIGRSQKGNNNVYCQDNAMAWHQWKLDETETQFLDFARRVVGLRRKHPNFRRHNYEMNDPVEATSPGGLEWIRPDGKRMNEEDWQHHWIKSLALYLKGTEAEVRDQHGRTVPDDDFIILFNASHQPVHFIIPPDLPEPWTLVFDTFGPDSPSSQPEPLVPSEITLQSHSLALLRHAR
jgi:isoamylase